VDGFRVLDAEIGSTWNSSAAFSAAPGTAPEDFDTLGLLVVGGAVSA
jgi:hypothetical protein